MGSKTKDSWHETDFERWFDVHPFLPDGERILLVGRHQPIRRMVDLIGLDREGGLVILEVKNGKSDQRAIGHALEYLAHYDDVSTETLLDGDDQDAHEAFREAFVGTFGTEPPPQIRTRRRVYLVAPAHDSQSAVCTRYLSRHLSQDEITIQLLKATKSPGGFALEEFQCPPFERTSALGRTFAVSARGRVFYLLEPGPAPVVWSVGKLRDSDATIAFRSRPARRTLRELKWHLMPMQHPEQVDLSHSGSVWKQRDKADRFGKVIATARSGERGAPDENQVLFAAFRGNEFREFRMLRADEFFSQWALSERPLPDWRTIAQMAEQRIVERKAAKQLKKKASATPSASEA